MPPTLPIQDLQARLNRNGYPVSQTHTFGPVTLGYVSTFSATYARSKGQIVIGHSNTHPNLRNLTDAQVLAQIDPASAASGYMRPPYGAWDARVTKLLASKGFASGLGPGIRATGRARRRPPS